MKNAEINTCVSTAATQKIRNLPAAEGQLAPNLPTEVYLWEYIFHVFTRRRLWMVGDDTSSGHHQPFRPLCFITPSHSPVLSSFKVNLPAPLHAKLPLEMRQSMWHASAPAPEPQRQAGWKDGWSHGAWRLHAASRWWRQIKKQTIMSYQGEIKALAVYVSTPLPATNSEVGLLWWGFS